MSPKLILKISGILLVTEFMIVVVVRCARGRTVNSFGKLSWILWIVENQASFNWIIEI